MGQDLSLTVFYILEKKLMLNVNQHMCKILNLILQKTHKNQISDKVSPHKKNMHLCKTIMAGSFSTDFRDDFKSECLLKVYHRFDPYSLFCDINPIPTGLGGSKVFGEGEWLLY